MRFLFGSANYIDIFYGSSLLTERATDGGLASEDWALNLEICDIINETDEGWVVCEVAESVDCQYDHVL